MGRRSRSPCGAGSYLAPARALGFGDCCGTEDQSQVAPAVRPTRLAKPVADCCGSRPQAHLWAGQDPSSGPKVELPAHGRPPRDEQVHDQQHLAQPQPQAAPGQDGCPSLEKLSDVVGLYLNPPQDCAGVFRAASQIQALPGSDAQGTMSLDNATAQRSRQGHRTVLPAQPSLKFLLRIPFLDNYVFLKLVLIERWFGELTTKRPQVWNQDPKPFARSYALPPSRLFQTTLPDRPDDVAHASRRAVSPFVATCLVGAPAFLLGGGMPARMPAQHAESVRHVACEPNISESIADSSRGQSTILAETKPTAGRVRL